MTSRAPTHAPEITSGIAGIWHRHRWLLLLVAILGSAATIGLSIMLPPKYKATAQLYVDPRDLKVLDNQVAPQIEAQNIGTTLVETQALILTSDTLLRQVIDALDLTNDAEFNGTPRYAIDRFTSWLKSIGTSLGGGTKEPSDVTAITLENLRGAIDVYRMDRTYVINASATAETRLRAKEVLDSLVGIFLTYQSKSRADAAMRSSQDLNDGIATLRNDVVAWEEKVSQYKRENNLIGAGGQIISEQQLSDLNTQLITAEVDAARLKARLDALPRSARDIDKVPEAVASQTLRELRTLVARVGQRRAQLGTQLRPNHPDMRSVVQSERQVTSEVSDELARIRSSIAVDYARARGNELALAAKLEDLRSKLNTANSAQIRLRELERNLEVARSIYAQAITRTKEASEQARLNTANVSVISKAYAPQRKTFPPPIPLLAIAGFLFGLVLAFILLHLRSLARENNFA